MPAPITLPRLDEQQQADLQQRYKEAPDAETRTRYQMLVLAQLLLPRADLYLQDECNLPFTRRSPASGAGIGSAWPAADRSPG